MAMEAKSYASEPVIDLSKFPIISQGAEAKVYDGIFLGKPTIIKQRFSKKYRHPSLDSRLTRLRFKQEVRGLSKARKLGILVPAIYYAESDASTIYLEKLFAKTSKELLLPGRLGPEDTDKVLRSIGMSLARLHDGDMVHGDLTTSNLLVRDSDLAVVMIDFGLTHVTTSAEDKAVDLYVLERAVTSTAASSKNVFQGILNSYRQNSKNGKQVVRKFEEVRMRGRKRTMVG